jgi:hypothetical protein
MNFGIRSSIDGNTVKKIKGEICSHDVARSQTILIL